MKQLTLVFLLFSLNAIAQKSEIFHIDSLPTEGVLLNKGWKFHAGDNPDFAKSDFNDSAWEGINPTLDVHDTLPQIPRPSGICWFRLHLSIDKNVLKNPLALRISQSGASEMYENGVFLRHFGVLSSNPNEIKAFDPLNKPITFNSNKDTNIVLAVRYTLQPNVHYTMLLSRQNPALQIRLNDSDRAFNQYSNGEIRGSDSKTIRIGIFFIICILFLSYYLYDTQQKANLYFTIYALLTTICEIVAIIPNTVDKIYYRYNVSLDAYQLSGFLLLTALYFLLNQKRTWVYWSLLGLTILAIFVNAWSYHLGNMLSSTIIGNLINIEIVRITFKSIKIKKGGAWIIAAGGICFAVFWIAFLSSAPFFLNYWLTPFLNTIYTVGDVLYNLAVLSIPIAVTVYMGLDIANTNLLLRQKLVEVEALSAENHQILSTQNETLEKQVTERTSELNQSLNVLKATQNQLIQSEKLASLGELTAGIAHEIQNPLNFVNNFSELSVDLVKDLKDEIEKPAQDKEYIGELFDDLSQNQEKINHHGKRASSIVKGMLEHSRASTGVKELTDINKLADEYFRLSYHGIRAKDKDFNATMEMHFQDPLSKIEIIPQDIGRVLLNLINNAFYAVNQRQQQLCEGFKPSQSLITYTPSVSVTTQQNDNQIIIKVKDNGMGMSEVTKAKVFQPFFTTKPTGSGTGLGLSLAYDIVTKGHDGILEVESEEGIGTTFIIKLQI